MKPNFDPIDLGMTPKGLTNWQEAKREQWIIAFTDAINRLLNEGRLIPAFIREVGQS